MVTIYKILYNLLFVAGYLATTVLAAVIGHFGRQDIGFGIFAAATALHLLLLIVGSVITGRSREAVLAAQETSAIAVNGPVKIQSVRASASYQYDARTVWSVIRPAESAVLLSDAKHAFTVPGTPSGIGEQQCFISHDGSVSIIEVIGEDSPWWATTRPIANDEGNQRFTYRLEPTATGCTLTMGAILELPANATFAADPNVWWENHSRSYLNRIQEVLSARPN
ncbi:hypothetical protein [Paenarthrobacter sp. 22069]|uniref:hypothetical protein n=1 Tax=Paenarthrobacter sp. 22069 TaxID=3453864 RepID=UPI003F8649A9